jgi:hypothetical protein
MRIMFLRSREAKQRVLPALSPANVDKTLQAPVTTIVAQDLEFYEQLPKLFPHADARSWFLGNQPLIETTAFRNSSLQGAVDSRGPRVGAGRRTDVRLRQREGRSRVLSRWSSAVELPGEQRLRRLVQLASRGPRLAFEEAAEML